MKVFMTVLLAALAVASTAAGQVYVTEDVTVNTVWTYDAGPYIIQNDITVSEGCTLTVEPGVDVKFDGPHWLQTSTNGGVIVANGEIDINGTSEDRRIGFTPHIGSAGGRAWMGVKVVNSDASSFEFCSFYAAECGLLLDSSDAVVFGSRFNNCAVGIQCVDSSPSISNSDFFSCNTGINLWNRESTPTIHSSNFTENHLWNILLQGYDPPLVTIDARECYWWPGGADAIEEGIYHDVDDPGVHGHVDFSDWLPESAVKPTSWGRMKALFAD